MASEYILWANMNTGYDFVMSVHSLFPFLHNSALCGPIFLFFGSNMTFPHELSRLEWFLMVSDLIKWVKLGQKAMRP